MTRSSNGAAASVEDGRLMRRVAEGNVDAFEQLYDRYCERAYRVARSVCRDQALAEDAMQEAFAALWRSRASYEPRAGGVSAWLLTVVRHRAIDVARRNGRHAGRRVGLDAFEPRAAGEEVIDQVLQREQAVDAVALLERLPDAQREVVVLAYFGELTHTEIARRLNIPAGTVKGRMRLGLQKLRAQVAPVAG